MIENVMHQMGGIGIFGLISICLFFAFFSGMLFWAAFLKKPYLNSMCALPLDEDGSDAVLGVPNQNSVAHATSTQLPNKIANQD